MPLPIQRPAIGFLELLGLRGSGENPRQVSDELSGSLDLTWMYLAGLERAVTQQTATSVVGPGIWVALSVPQGEYWLVTNISLSASGLGVGEAFHVVPVIIGQGGSRIEGSGDNFVASDNPFMGRNIEPWAICAPGTQFAVGCISMSGAGRFWTVYVDYFRLAF